MAIKGHSASLHVGNQADFATSTTFTKLAKLTELGGITLEAEDVDVSHMDSPDQFEQTDPGWANAGSVEATLQYEKAQQEDVLDLFRVPKGFKVAFSDGSFWGFSGFVASVGNEVERKGIVTLKVKIRISGKPEFTAAAA